jgi:hypothetical protein
VVIDIQRGYDDVYVRIALREFSFEFLKQFGTTGTQRQVAALGGERAGHSGTQAGAGTGDQYYPPSHWRSIAT